MGTWAQDLQLELSFPPDETEVTWVGEKVAPGERKLRMVLSCRTELLSMADTGASSLLRA